MEEKNIKKLWHLCAEIRDFCDSHNDCSYCPFNMGFNGCRIKTATDESIDALDELLDLFPEDIMEEE